MPNSIESPPDRLADFDVTLVSDQILAEYRMELQRAILDPGGEYEVDDDAGEAYYKKRLALADAELMARGLGPKGGNLP